MNHYYIYIYLLKGYRPCRRPDVSIQHGFPRIVLAKGQHGFKVIAVHPAGVLTGSSSGCMRPKQSPFGQTAGI